MISNGKVSVHELADPAVQLGEINIGGESGPEPIKPNIDQQPIIQLLGQLVIDLVQPQTEQPSDPLVAEHSLQSVSQLLESLVDEPIDYSTKTMTYPLPIETSSPGGEETNGDLSTPEIGEEPVSEASTHISSARDTEFVRQIDMRLMDTEMGEVSDSKATGHNNRGISEVISRGLDRASSTEQFSVIRQPGVDAYMNQIGRTVRRHSKWWSGVDTSDDNFKDLIKLAIEARRQR